MLFTTIPVPPSAKSSELFIQHRNGTDAPAAVSTVSIYGITAHSPFAWRSFSSMLGYHVVATARGAIIQAGKKKSFDFLSVQVKQDLTPPPRVAVSAVDKFSEKAVQKLEEYGLIRQVRRGQEQFHGTLQIPNLGGVLTLGIDVRTFVQSGITNVRGLLAWNMTQKLVIGILATISSPFRNKNSSWQGASVVKSELSGHSSARNDTEGQSQHFDPSVLPQVDALGTIDGGVTYSATPAGQSVWRVTNDSEIAGTLAALKDRKGIFFPYFPRMTLPDKEYVPRFLISHVRPALGSKLSDQIVNITTLDQGWASLSDTEPGLALTHMVFCIDQALQVCAKPVLIYSRADEYIGTVLFGDHFSMIKNGTLHEAKEFEGLIEEIQSFDSHEDALVKIASLLSASKLVDRENEVEELSISVLSSVRAIHKETIKRTIPQESIGTFGELLKKLNFRQTFWDVANASKLRVLMECIANGTTLGIHEPMLPRVDVVMNRSPIMSALAAYGHSAPTLYMPGGRILVIPRIGEKKLQDMPRTGEPQKKLLPGFAIYAKPLVQAVEAWKQVMVSHSIGVLLAPNGAFYRATAVKTGDEAESLYALTSKLFAAPLDPKLEKGKGKRTVSQKEEEIARDERSKKRRLAAEKEATELATILAAQGINLPGPSKIKATESMDTDAKDSDDDL